MTLEDLKKRATASELTLIEAVEAALRPAIIAEVRKKAFEFVNANPPPTREEMRFMRSADEALLWGDRFKEALNTP